MQTAAISPSIDQLNDLVDVQGSRVNGSAPVYVDGVYVLTSIYTQTQIDSLFDSFTPPDLSMYSLVTHNHDDRYSLLTHNHDNIYATINHNHDDRYSLLTHNHTGVYSPANHNHDGVYALVIHNHDSVYAPISHNHDDRYYTESEVNTALGAKANISGQTFSGPIIATNLSGTNTGDQDLSGYSIVSHNHDDRYFTENEVTTLLTSKAAISGQAFSGPITATNLSGTNTGDQDLSSLASTSSLTAHTSNTSNPHGVTKSQIGLGSVPNTDTTNATNISTGTLANARLTFDPTLLAPLANPVFTGNPQAPTPAPGDNDTSVATTAFVQAVKAEIYGGVPSTTLDTIKEVSDELLNNQSVVGALTTVVGTKAASAININTAGLVTGGGNLTADRTITLTGPTIFTDLLTRDGSGSGLDSDLVRGVTPSTYGLSLLDDADASTARSTLGLGTMSVATSSNYYTASATDTLLNAKQPLDAELIAIAGLTSAADKSIYFTGSGTASTYDLSTFARTILDDANAAGVRSTISAQASHGNLTDFSSVTFAANKSFFYDGSGTATTYTLTTAGVALVGGADASAQRTTLGLGTMALAATANYYDISGVNTLFSGRQPIDATLTAFAGLTIAANSLTIGTGTDAFSQTTFAANTFPARASTGNLVTKTITDFGLSLVDDADAATARATLIAAGTSVANNFTHASGQTVGLLTFGATDGGYATFDSTAGSIWFKKNIAFSNYAQFTNINAGGSIEFGDGSTYVKNSGGLVTLWCHVDRRVGIGGFTYAGNAQFEINCLTATDHVIKATGTSAQTGGHFAAFQPSSTGTHRVQFVDYGSWATSTDAIRKARRIFTIADTAEREVLRFEANGAAAMIGFLGASAVLRQSIGSTATDAATTQTLVNNIRTALINLGLCIT